MCSFFLFSSRCRFVKLCCSLHITVLVRFCEITTAAYDIMCCVEVGLSKRPPHTSPIFHGGSEHISTDTKKIAQFYSLHVSILVNHTSFASCGVGARVPGNSHGPTTSSTNMSDSGRVLATLIGNMYEFQYVILVVYAIQYEYSVPQRQGTRHRTCALDYYTL